MLAGLPVSPQHKLATAEVGLGYLLQHCQLAVVTLSERGCLAGRQQQPGMVVRQPGVADAVVVDSTGSADLFAAG